MDTKKRVLSLISLLLLFALTGCGLESDIPTEKFIERARGHIEKGDMKSGIIELKNALQKKPDSVEARILLGQTYHTIGLGKEAEKEFRKALELGVQGDSIKINLGDALLLQSKFDQILEEVQPGKGTSQPNLAKIYRLRGDAELGLGQLEEGCVFFRKAVDLDDTNVPAYWGLANCAMARKDTDEARRQINIALKLEPENASTWTRIGDIERFSGSAEDAEAAYTKALEISPESKEALAGRILTRIAKNDVASAKQDLNKLTAVSPNSVSTNMLQGIVFYLEGKFDNALEVLQKAQSMQPDNAGVIRLLGLVHYQQGNLNQAVAELTQYLNFDLNDTLVRKVLGASFLRLASPDRAIEVLMPVLSKDQSDPQILEMASAAYTGSQNFT
ncbi:MAG TPA: tetratricopeptide repeat protein, partial [Gammaproteobacteria bacterium]|nr:tetratricopeptide repeat protein [Gammaproteobacteria bacterium]